MPSQTSSSFTARDLIVAKGTKVRLGVWLSGGLTTKGHRNFAYKSDGLGTEPRKFGSSH